jgi:hypothetical protein
MLGPALRGKHAIWEQTFACGMSRFSTIAVESLIRPGAHSHRWTTRKFWSQPLAEVERMLTPQSRAKHGTRNSRDSFNGQEIPYANNPCHPTALTLFE